MTAGLGVAGTADAVEGAVSSVGEKSCWARTAAVLPAMAQVAPRVAAVQRVKRKVRFMRVLL
jgi:hypothetical protein